MSIDAEGKGTVFGAAFSQKGITQKILKLVENAAKSGGVDEYCIVHANNLALALEYKTKMREIIGKDPAYISEISSVVAIHSGPGSVAVCLTKK